jgi:GT2 family glycosyltransferase
VAGQGARNGVTVSVVIPTRNRDESLSRLFGALARQEYSAGFEVIVVNDGGERFEIDGWPRHEHCEEVRVIELDERRGVSTARNRGAEAARFEVLGFLDDDTCPRADWLRRVTTVMGERLDVVALTGRVEATSTDRALDRLRDHAYRARYREHLQSPPVTAADALETRALRRARYLAGGNCAVRASHFQRTKGFDESFASLQDRELGLRLAQDGYGVFYDDDLVVEHDNYARLAHLTSGRFRSGRYSIRLEEKHDVGTGPQPLRVLVGSRLLAFGREAGWRTAGAALLSVVAYRAGRTWERLVRPAARDEVTRRPDTYYLPEEA